VYEEDAVGGAIGVGGDFEGPATAFDISPFMVAPRHDLEQRQRLLSIICFSNTRLLI